MAATQEGNEEIQLQIEERLMGMNTAGLGAFAQILNIQEPLWKDQSRYIMLTVIRKHIDGGADQDDDPLVGKKTFLSKALDILKAQQKEPKTEPDVEEGVTKIEIETVPLI